MANIISAISTFALKAGSLLENASEILSGYSSALTPVGLTDEYWKSDESIQSTKFFGLYSYTTRYYELSGEAEAKFVANYVITGDEKAAMRMLFREDYENGTSYQVDKILQLPAHLFKAASIVIGGASYLPYGIHKILEKGEEMMNAYFPIQEEVESPYQAHDGIAADFIDPNIAGILAPCGITFMSAVHEINTQIPL